MSQGSEQQDAPTLYNQGNALRRAGQLEQALGLYERALALRPDLTSARLNRGNTLHDLGRHADAARDFSQLLERDPGNVAALHNRANAWRELGQHRQACEDLEAALAQSPGDARIEWNLALAELRLGRFEAGWHHYEARWRRDASLAALRPRTGRPWTGEDCRGKTVLLYGEQGLGDVLQFVRYAPLLAARGARVLLQVAAPLVTLLRRCPGVAEVVATGHAAPHFELHCALMSLPALLGTTGASIPEAVPYLSADTDRLAHWRARLGARKGLRVGLVWAGNPRHENDRWRSVELEQLLAALDAPAQFVCLQRELRDGDRETLARWPQLLFFGTELKDFDDTAALCELMDVVISVDTSVAHLAGALGKPLWLLLPQVPDWRWMLEREDSPWYPTARLFRQHRTRDWAPVLQRVAGALAGWVPPGVASARALGADIQVISLARTPQRLAGFAQAHPRLPYQVFPAVEGREQAADALRAQGLFDGSVDYVPGAVGCALSHLRLWERAIETGQPVTVCEDDARLHADFVPLATRLIESLGPDWDFVLWGWNFDAMLLCRLIPGLSACDLRFSQPDMRRNGPHYLASPVDPRPYRLMRAFGIPAYTLSAQGARKFRQHVLPVRRMDVHFPGINRTLPNTGIDIMMNALYPSAQAHVCFPPLALTDNEHAISTIQTPPAQA